MEKFSALLALCGGNSPVTGEFPSQRSVTRSFDVFFDLCLNKRLSKQSWSWFETPPCSLWPHCNAKNAVCKMAATFLGPQSVNELWWIHFSILCLGEAFFNKKTLQTACFLSFGQGHCKTPIKNGPLWLNLNVSHWNTDTIHKSR